MSRGYGKRAHLLPDTLTKRYLLSGIPKPSHEGQSSADKHQSHEQKGGVLDDLTVSQQLQRFP